MKLQLYASVVCTSDHIIFKPTGVATVEHFTQWLEREGISSCMAEDQWGELKDLGSVMILPTPHCAILVVAVCDDVHSTPLPHIPNM